MYSHDDFRALQLICRAVIRNTVCSALIPCGETNKVIINFSDINFTAEVADGGTKWKIYLSDEDKRGAFMADMVSILFQPCWIKGTVTDVTEFCKRMVVRWLWYLYRCGSWEYLPEWNEIPEWPHFEPKVCEPVTWGRLTWDTVLGKGQS